MSLLEKLKPYPGKKQKKRLGRGKGSGKGGISTRGHKGQRARKSGNAPAGFEGGAMPLARRLPKFGFTNAPFKTVYEIVNLSQLNQLEGDITPELLVSKGLVKKRRQIKILGQGEISKPLKVKAHKFSKKAKEQIEKAGGQISIL
ncbi:MAG: 50S ribosomal protein L15 [Bdellovibrionaceae bacterium]|nr:50S ribosomal protein L15 [Pseudobdellovibrionaceae bacterium]